jgi:biotin carboxylase
MDGWVIVFVSNECVVAEGPLRAAKAANLKTLVAAIREPCVSTGLMDRFVKLPDRGHQRVAEVVLSSARNLQAKAILAYDDWDVVPAAVVANQLGLPFISFDAARAATNKFIMRQKLNEHGVAVPSFKLYEIGDDPRDIGTQFNFPVVVKPAYGQGSQGVIRANDLSELGEAFDYTSRIIISHDLRPSVLIDRSGIVVEEYIDGDEFTVEILTRNGEPHVLAIFDKPDPLTGPYFEEGIYVTPTRVNKKLKQSLIDTAISGCRALGLHIGPCHCELRVSGETPYVLEIGARPIGGFCSQVFAKALGFDMHELVVKNAIGIPFSVPNEEFSGAAGVIMLPVPGRGVLRSVSGVQRALKLDGVKSVDIHIEPGQTILPYPEQSCYIGTVVAAGNSQDEVISTLRTAAKEIRFDLK